MSKFATLVAKLKVILKAAPTWIITAALIVPIVADEVGKVVPAGWQDNVVSISGRVLAILGAAAAIIRRVTPVAKDQRGILPK